MSAGSGMEKSGDGPHLKISCLFHKLSRLDSREGMNVRTLQMVGRWRSVDTNVMATAGSYGVFTGASIPLGESSFCLVGPLSLMKICQVWQRNSGYVAK